MEKKEKYVVTATELKQNFGKYMARVEEQCDVVITKNGTKAARLTPYVTDLDQYLLVRERALDYQYSGRKVSFAEYSEISGKSELRLEYISGEIYVLASPSITHQRILGQLHLTFSGHFKGHECEVFVAPFDVHFYKKDIDDPDVCQPDLLVVCDLQGNVTDEDRYAGTPTLVVEILSGSTRAKDMIDKLNTYRLAGVAEYWIVDPKQANIIVYGFEDREIDRYKIYERGTLAQSFFFMGLNAPIDELFGLGD